MPYLGSAPAEKALEASDIASDAVTTAKIANDAVDVTKINLISTSSVPSVEAKGDGSSDGYIQLNCSQNSHGIKLKSPPHSAGQSYTLTYPQSVVDGGFMKTDSSGNLSFASAGAIEKIFIAENSGNQVIGTGSWTTVTFDTEVLDQGGHFASNKFTAPSDGKYMFYVTHMYMEGSGTVDQRMSINHYNSSDSLQLQRSVFKTTVHEASMSGVAAFSLSATDYVVMQVYHAKGSNANLYKAQMFGWRVV